MVINNCDLHFYIYSRKFSSCCEIVLTDADKSKKYIILVMRNNGNIIYVIRFQLNLQKT